MVNNTQNKVEHTLPINLHQLLNFSTNSVSPVMPNYLKLQNFNTNYEDFKLEISKQYTFNKTRIRNQTGFFF